MLKYTGRGACRQPACAADPAAASALAEPGVNDRRLLGAASMVCSPRRSTTWTSAFPI